MSKNTFFAPGKLMLFGDWSVLEPGNISVAAAVDRGVKVSVEPSSEFSVYSKDIVSEPWVFSFKNGHVEGIPNEWSFFVSLFETFFSYCVSEDAQPIKIEIFSEITKTASGEKLGFGSSAALTVALMSALSVHYESGFSEDELLKLSLFAHYKAQGNVGSGFDIATSFYGGYITYQMPLFSELPMKNGRVDIFSSWPGLNVERIPFVSFDVVTAFSGKGSSSRELMRRMSGFKEKNKDGYFEIIDSLNNEVHELILIMRSGACTNIFFDHVKNIRQKFIELQEQSGIMLETKIMSKAIHTAEELGYASKFSGAGGGDSIIGFCCTNEETEKLKKEWGKLSVELVSIGIDFYGVRAV